MTTFGAFWLSATVGLFGLHETSSGTSRLLAEPAEIGCMVFGLIAGWLHFVRGRAETPRVDRETAGARAVVHTSPRADAGAAESLPGALNRKSLAPVTRM